MAQKARQKGLFISYMALFPARQKGLKLKSKSERGAYAWLYTFIYWGLCALGQQVTS